MGVNADLSKKKSRKKISCGVENTFSGILEGLSGSPKTSVFGSTTAFPRFYAEAHARESFGAAKSRGRANKRTGEEYFKPKHGLVFVQDILSEVFDGLEDGGYLFIGYFFVHVYAADAGEFGIGGGFDEAPDDLLYFDWGIVYYSGGA